MQALLDTQRHNSPTRVLRVVCNLPLEPLGTRQLLMDQYIDSREDKQHVLGKPFNLAIIGLSRGFSISLAPIDVAYVSYRGSRIDAGSRLGKFAGPGFSHGLRWRLPRRPSLWRLARETRLHFPGDHR